MISQFCCTSLWFAGNGVMKDLVQNFNLSSSALSNLTSAVQFGFILGTLVFAIFSIADRYSPSKVFLYCALLGGLFNLAVVWDGNNLDSILVLRFFTGFFLAGIYPVGMKIAADYFEKGLGKSLGLLVGALVLGTAFPHLAKDLLGSLPWKSVLILTSALAALGGLFMFLFVPNGPFRKAGQKVNLSAFLGVFKNRDFRSAAFGYFGHMWELYAFWAFVPILLQTYAEFHPEVKLNIPLLSFIVIGIGAFGSVTGGFLAQIFGTKKMAIWSLLFSGICCLISPFMFDLNSVFLFLGFLLFWGMVVIADSPLFSTLVAQNVKAETKGTALTIVNSIGFGITIISIQLLNYFQDIADPKFIYLILAMGPLFGLIFLRRKSKIVRAPFL